MMIVKRSYWGGSRAEAREASYLDKKELIREGRETGRASETTPKMSLIWLIMGVV